MSGIIFSIDLEHDIPEIHTPDFAGDDSLVESTILELDAIASKHRVAPFKDFSGNTWHMAHEGLATIRAVISHLEQEPSAVFYSSHALTRLRVWERRLVAAQAANVKWKMRVELA